MQGEMSPTVLHKEMSASTFQREFQLDAVFDYVKTGIGSIIEDEVTQRFVAEELKVLVIVLFYLLLVDSLYLLDVEFADENKPKLRVCQPQAHHHLDHGLRCEILHFAAWKNVHTLRRGNQPTI